MTEKKENEGITVKEIEAFAKKNRFQVAFCLAVLFACLFSFFMSMMGFSILAATIGAIFGIFFPEKINGIAQKVLQFVGKQEQTTQLVLAAVLIIISIFLSPFIFLIVGLHGGKDMKTMSQDISGKK